MQKYSLGHQYLKTDYFINVIYFNTECEIERRILDHLNCLQDEGLLQYIVIPTYSIKS